jgi:hypothetical protein
MSGGYGIQHGLPCLKGFVIHCEIRQALTTQVSACENCTFKINSQEINAAPQDLGASFKA